MSLTAHEYVRTEQSCFTPPLGETIEIVPFGIYHVDLNFLMGVMPTQPQIRSIQGIEGARKTSLAFNLIVNMCLSGLLPQGHKIIYMILESGMTIEKCMAILRCILATKYIIYRYHFGFRDPSSGENMLDYLRQLFNLTNAHFENGHVIDILKPIVTTFNGQPVPECSLKYDLIRKWYLGKINLTPKQNAAWIIAGDALAQFPLEFYGISGHYDREQSKHRSFPARNIEASLTLWKRLYDEVDSLQIFIDHITAYDLPGDAYHKKIAAMPYITRFIDDYHNTFWLLDQEGVSNRRDFDSKGEVLGSKGGSEVKAEADTNWRVSYPRQTDPFHMILHQPVKSREGDHPDLELMIEPNSGAIFGRSKIKIR